MPDAETPTIEGPLACCVVASFPLSSLEVQDAADGSVWSAGGFACNKNTGFHCIFVNLPSKPSLRDLVRYATLMPWMLAWVLSRVSFRGALMRWTLSLRACGVKMQDRIGSLRTHNSGLFSKRFFACLSY